MDDVVWALAENGLIVEKIRKVDLETTGALKRKAKQYLERYYGIVIGDESIRRIRGDRVWVRDDPPRYTIMARKSWCG